MRAGFLLLLVSVFLCLLHSTPQRRMGMVENVRCKFAKFDKDIAVYIRTLAFVANKKCAPALTQL